MHEQRPLTLAAGLMLLHSALDDLRANVEFGHKKSDDWRSTQCDSIANQAEAIKKLSREGVDAVLHEALGETPRTWTVEMILLIGEVQTLARRLADPQWDELWTEEEIEAARGVADRVRRKYKEARAVAMVPAGDTKADTPKKQRKKLRELNVPAIDCARRFKDARKTDPTITMKQVVVEYVEDTHAGSVTGIMRVLNDHPEQWKDDTETT